MVLHIVLLHFYKLKGFDVNIKQMILLASLMLVFYFALSCLPQKLDCELTENIDNPKCKLKNNDIPIKIYK